MKEYVSLQTVLDIVMQYCPDDDGSCMKVDRDIRDLLDEIEALPIVELQTIKDVVVPNLEKNNIKRVYPDMTDGEVAAYILGFNEHEKLNMGHCYIDSEGYERCSVCNEHETGMRYFTFCPRCGVWLKHFETEGKVLAVGLGGSFKDSLIKTEVDGLFLNFEQED